MRRGLGLLLGVGLLVGGAAACSDDDSGAGAEPTTTAAVQTSTTVAGDTADTSTGGGTGDTGDGTETTTAGGVTPTTVSDDPVVAANDELIARFCAAKEEYDAALQVSLDNPDDFAQIDRVRELSGVLSEASDALAPVIDTLTPEQAAQLQQCQADE